MWLPLAILGHTIQALGFLGDKLFVEKVLPRPKVLVFFSGAGGIFYFLLAPWFFEVAPFGVAVAGIFSGAISVPALFYFYRAIDRDEISRVVPAIGSIMPIAVFLLSFWILGERLGSRSYIAFLFLAVGGILVAVHSYESLFKKKNYTLFFLEILVACLFALSAVLMKYAFEGTNDISAFLWSRIGSVGAVLFLLSDQEVRRRVSFVRLGKKETKKEVLYVVTRIFAGIAPLLILVATSFGSVTLVNALQGLQYPILFLLALFFSRYWPRIFHEEFSVRAVIQKTVASIFIVAGLALLV